MGLQPSRSLRSQLQLTKLARPPSPSCRTIGVPVQFPVPRVGYLVSEQSADGAEVRRAHEARVLAVDAAVGGVERPAAPEHEVRRLGRLLPVHSRREHQTSGPHKPGEQNRTPELQVTVWPGEHQTHEPERRTFT